MECNLHRKIHHDSIKKASHLRKWLNPVSERAALRDTAPPEISKSLVAELPGRTAVQEFKQWMDTSSSQLVKSSVTLNSVWDHLSENIGSQNLTHFLLWDFEKSSCCQVLLLHISFYWLNLHTVLDQGNYLVFLLWHLSRIPQGKE